MVNRNKDTQHQDDVEITTDNEQKEFTDPDLETIEENQGEVIKTLREKLKLSETEKRLNLEEMQRTKADFLNARKRLEEERLRDRERQTIAHIERLIPLCDSFMMAMSDKNTWEKADENWRKGIEGIFGQLQQLLLSYGVTTLSPQNEPFDPKHHEALSTSPVTDEAKHDTVVTVIQPGYLLKLKDDTTELIRPARVSIGVFTDK